jgi:hypothetical protein
VHAQNLIVYQRGDRQTIKAVCKNFPQLDCVSSLALIVEAVNAINASTLVIASQQEKVFGILYLVR